MTAVKIAIGTVLLLAVASTMGAAPRPSPLCPPGWNASFNVNGLGCTFCFAPPPDCQIGCLLPPTGFCPVDDPSCCAANPCFENCDPNAPQCNVASCSCQPGTCCLTVCPSATPAPATSTAGIAVLAVVLVALGMTTVRLRSRLR